MNITISRPKQYADRMRAYKLYVDDKELTKIRAGESIDINLPASSKFFWAKIDWARTPNFNLAALKHGDRLIVKSNLKANPAFPFVAFYYAFVKPNKWLTIEKEAN